MNVNYRRSCDFRIEDSERDLSAQFIDMDEQFFTPTMAKYQQQQQEQQQKQKQQQEDTDGYFRSSAIATTRPVSMFTKATTGASLENKLVSILFSSSLTVKRGGGRGGISREFIVSTIYRKMP